MVLELPGFTPITQMQFPSRLLHLLFSLSGLFCMKLLLTQMIILKLKILESQLHITIMTPKQIVKKVYVSTVTAQKLNSTEKQWSQ